jgi:hypothetical protein
VDLVIKDDHDMNALLDLIIRNIGTIDGNKNTQRLIEDKIEAFKIR